MIGLADQKLSYGSVENGLLAPLCMIDDCIFEAFASTSENSEFGASKEPRDYGRKDSPGPTARTSQVKSRRTERMGYDEI